MGSFNKSIKSILIYNDNILLKLKKVAKQYFVSKLIEGDVKMLQGWEKTLEKYSRAARVKELLSKEICYK